MRNFQNNKITVLIFLLIFLLVNAKTYNITEFAAVGDGKTISTQAIQSAINQLLLMAAERF